MTFVGMGDAALGDPEDFDVEVRDLVNAIKDKRLTCSGTLVNLTKRKLSGLTLRCSGDRKETIEIAELGPSASQPFSQTFDVDDKAWAWFEVLASRAPLVLRNATLEARAQQVFDVASAVYEQTKLALIDHSITPLSVTVRAQASFVEL